MRAQPWLLAACTLVAYGAATASAQEPTGPVAPATAPPVSAAPTPPTEPGTATPPAATEAPSAPTDATASPEPSDAPATADADGPAADAAAGGWGDLSEFADEAAASEPMFQAKLYGFIDSYWEKTAETAAGIDADGNTTYEDNPYEFDVANFNLMVQGSIYNRYRFFVNIAAPGAGSNIDDEGLTLRNAWVEAPIVDGYLNVRAGKTYRRFGLYNEILDCVPTFIGIEPPELFDKDHLMVTRTTSLMLHGAADLGAGVLNYSLTTGQDESTGHAVPVGGDAYFEMPFGLRLGSSFYTTGGDAAPGRAVGDGSPRGGVVNWMANDRYYILGGYAQLRNSGVILQAEYWEAHHDATRDSDAVMAVADGGGFNPTQMGRFFDGSGNVVTATQYTVRTFYVRAGYEIPWGDLGSVTPYAQFDYYANPETVQEKDFGGDNEAGASDEGSFEKYTVGVVLRPVPQVALKVDHSGHIYTFNNHSEFYPEVRVSFSYLWELPL